MVQYGKVADDSLISGDELNNRMLDYARSFKAPVVKPVIEIEDDIEEFNDPLTIEDTELEELAPFITPPSSPPITDDIEDLNNLVMEDLSSPALEVLDDFPNIANQGVTGGYQYPIQDFRVPTISGEEIYGLGEIKEALGISPYNSDIDSWDIQRAIDSYLENPNRNTPSGVDASIWNWLVNINTGGF